MTGTITRFVISDCVFVSLANGNEAAFRIAPGPFGDVNASFFIRWAWDTNFTPVGAANISADETSLIKTIMTTAHLWNTGTPTWAELENGASYVSPADGQTYEGGFGIAKRFVDWTSTQTTAVCEQATDVQFFKGYILTWMQQLLDSSYLNLVTEGPPAPSPSPTQKFPPQKVGDIQSAMGLLLAQATRMTGSRDPANGNRVLVGSIAVPQ